MSSRQRAERPLEHDAEAPDRLTARPPSPVLAQQVRDALLHLYDLAHLQTHPLAQHLAPDRRHLDLRNGARDLGKALRQALLDSIEALDPGESALADSSASRGYRLLRLRYVDALDVVDVQRRLSIGKSEYHREHRKALGALTSLLGQHLAPISPNEPPTYAERDTTYQRLHVVALPAQKVPPSNLPIPLTSFVGRDRELAEATRHLSRTRLLTLTGAGGSGKTRLALEVAEQLLHDDPEVYPDGIWLVELAPLGDPSLVPQAVASTLRVREQPGRPILETLVDVVRGWQALVLLDNCEHLLDASARLTHALLSACPSLRILATSREPVGVTGETSWRVPSLATPNPDQFSATLDPATRLDQIEQYDAVRLFAERAGAAQPSFCLTDQNALAVARLCWQLDGMPLALELAATRIRGLTVEELVRHLDQRFRLLTSGSRTDLPRQQTLRATIDWSYSLLSDAEQALLNRLAVFVGGFRLEAAEEASSFRGAIDRSDVLELLLRLVDKSLVVAEPVGAVTRYRLLETIRQYGWEKLLESEDLEGARQAHAGCYLRLAEEAAPELEGPRLGEWLDRLERERGNLRAALDWFQEAGEVEEGLRLAHSLHSFWVHRGPWEEAKAHLQGLLDLPNGKEAPTAALALWELGSFTEAAGEVERGRLLGEEAFRLGRERGDRRLIPKEVVQLAREASDRDDHRRREQLELEACRIYQDMGDLGGVARCWLSLSRISRHLGDHTGWRSRATEALRLYREIGAPVAIAEALSALAEVELVEGNLAEAWALAEESTQILDGVGVQSPQAYHALVPARVLSYRGEYEAARLRIEELLRRESRRGNLGMVTVYKLQLGLVAIAREDYKLAKQLLHESISLNPQPEFRSPRANTLRCLGLLARAEGDLGRARSLLTESLSIARSIGFQIIAAHSQSELGVVDLLEGRLEDARVHFVESLRLKCQMNARIGIADSLECFGGLAALEGLAARAVRLLGAASRLREETGSVPPPVWRRQREDWLARARSELSWEEAEAARAEGQAMTLEQAVEYALQS